LDSEEEDKEEDIGNDKASFSAYGASPYCTVEALAEKIRQDYANSCA